MREGVACRLPNLVPVPHFSGLVLRANNYDVTHNYMHMTQMIRPGEAKMFLWYYQKSVERVVLLKFSNLLYILLAALPLAPAAGGELSASPKGSRHPNGLRPSGCLSWSHEEVALAYGGQ